jgi:DNA repair protein RecO (recombination protein O)
MPVRDSEAIVLRTYPLGDADRLVSLLTRSFGRLRGVAQGARRPKSRYGSTLEPMTYMHAWFYERETRDLVRLQQCDLLESFLDVQQDYRCGLALALLAEVSEAVLPEREGQDPAFRLLLLVARTIKQTLRPDLPVGYFLVWTMRLAGWLPEMDRCVACRREVGQECLYWSLTTPGLYCAQCRKLGMKPLAPEVLATTRRILAARLEKLATDPAAPIVTREFEEYFLDMIEHHTEHRMITRRLFEAPA